MTLAPGVRLGPYEILAPLGAGGMGEVWRARDTRLGREVAIKVLPAAFAADPALRARFDREAKSISSLNHPNICTLHDVGREGDTDYLVLELVEGETLAARLARGPLPLAELLRYGMQITDALEKAHRSGIVHRDLKPGNVMLTKAGAKLLDFGLARGGPLGGAPADATISPTVTGPLTAQGHIVGTFQYMAPEQLEGAEADARSDLWALGCVLYEMATGKPAFAGASQASLIGAIMREEPKPLSELTPMSPPALDRAIRQCLAKDPDERWQTAGDLRRELAWISASGSQVSMAGVEGVAGRGAARSLPRRLRAWAAPFLVGIALAAAAFLSFGRSTPSPPVRLAVVHPPSADMGSDPSDIALSPDGQSVAYVAGDSTGSILFVRRLDAGEPIEITRDPQPIRTPFWAPDGRRLAYFTSGEEGRLWRVSATGGTPVPLAPARSGRGGAWGRNGTILFCPAPEGPIYRVNEQGEGVVAVTALDTTAGDTSHRSPRFLDDGDRFLFSALPPSESGLAIRVGSVKKGGAHEILRVPDDGVEYAEPGYLLYRSAGSLVARRFDPRSLKIGSEVFRVATGLRPTRTLGHAVVSASRNGRLAWIPVAQPNGRLEWFDRAGGSLGRIDAPEGDYQFLSVSQDGRRGLVSRFSEGGTETEVWLIDPDRGAPRRVSPAGQRAYMPVFAPDGESFYMRSGTGRDEIYRVSLVRGGEPELVPTTDHQFKGPLSVTADGRTLLFFVLDRQTEWDLWALDLATEGAKPRVLHDDPTPVDGVLSPDGRFLAFIRRRSNADLHVSPIERPLDERRIATGVAGAPRWAADGRELLFARSDAEVGSLHAIPMDPATGMPTGPERLLFKSSDVIGWAVSGDGQRILGSLQTGRPEPARLEIALDWTKLPRAE